MTKYFGAAVSAFLLVAGLGPFSHAVHASADASEPAETYAGKMKDMQLAFQNTLEQQQKINADLLSRLGALEANQGQETDSSALRRKTIDLAGEEKRQRVLKSGASKMGKRSNGKGSSSEEVPEPTSAPTEVPLPDINKKICYKENVGFAFGENDGPFRRRHLEESNTDSRFFFSRFVADLGVIDVEEGEGILVQLSLTSILLKFLDVDLEDGASAFGGFASAEHFIDVTPSLLKCADDGCLSLTGDPITPKPSETVILKAEFIFVGINDDDDGFRRQLAVGSARKNKRRLDQDIVTYQEENASTNTATFFWPSGDLGEGSYDLVLSFDALGDSFALVFGQAEDDDDFDINSVISAELGPLIVQTETIMVDSEICPITEVDPDDDFIF